MVAEIVAIMSDRGVTIPSRNVRDTLDGLATLAAEEIEAGEDFTIPGVAKLTFTYAAPKKKGERWKKGDEVVGFGGIASIKDTDSPPVKPRIRLKATPTGAVAKLRPGTKPDAQAAFLKSAAGKAVIKRKG
jgi:hypothetical protein